MNKLNARELLDRMEPWMWRDEPKELAARVEKVLALKIETPRPNGPETEWCHGWNHALEAVWRLLNGEKQ